MRIFHRSLIFALLSAAIVAAAARAQTDLQVLKSGPSEAAAGADVTYDITLMNLGPDPSADPTLTDPIPAGMTFVSFTQNSGPAFSCTTPVLGDSIGTISCTIAILSAGQSANFSAVFNIPPSTAPGTYFTNIATGADPADENSENDSGIAVTSTPPPPSADMGILKSGPSSAGSDTDVVFQISVTNGGPNPGSNVTFSDTLPGTMTFVTLTQTSGPAMSCSTPAGGSGGTINCTAVTFAAGATATFTLTGHIPPGTPSGTVYSNTTTVSSSWADPNPENNTGIAQVTVSDVDLSVTKTGSAAATAGSDITYTLTVTNAGPDTATNVVMTDALPAGTTFVSSTQDTGPAGLCSSPPPGSNGTVLCSIALLPSSTSAQFTLIINIGNATSITNTVTVAGENYDPNPANNSASVSTTVAQIADIAVTKTGPATAAAGMDVTYTITVTNAGPSNAANVSLSDPLPAGTTFVSRTQTSGPTFTCNTPGATLTCTIALLPSGASAGFTLVVHVTPSTANGTVLTNTATVSSTTTDPAPGNNVSSTNATVSAAADLAVTKTGPLTVTAGSNVTYTVSVTNNGPADAANVVLTDALPANTTFVSATQTSGPAFSCTTLAGNTTCTAASLLTGASVTFSFVFTVSLTATGTISNTATVTSATTDPAPANNSATATTPIGAILTDVAITKIASATAFTGGTNVTYTITVTNNGPGIALGTTVTDVVPAGATFVSATPSQGSCSGTTTVTCALGTLAASATATIPLVVTLPAAGPVSNTATVTMSASNVDTNPANNSSTSTVGVFGSDVPALSPLALALLGFTLAAVAFFTQRLR